MAFRQIKHKSLRYKIPQLLLRSLYGKSPAQKGWHFYPVRQFSVGALMLCTYTHPDNGLLVALARRAGDVENTGQFSVSFGGYMDFNQNEHPTETACREAIEETQGALQVDQNRLELLYVAPSYHEQKYWDDDQHSFAVGYRVELTKDEYEKLQTVTSSEVSEVVFMTLEEALESRDQIAYRHEYEGLKKLK